MKILVEVLKPYANDGIDVDNPRLIVDKSKVFDFGSDLSQINIDRAKTKLRELRASLPTDHKLRVLEYHNDDPDKGRTACKILFEG